jgi:hypothetical protein
MFRSVSNDTFDEHLLERSIRKCKSDLKELCHSYLRLVVQSEFMFPRHIGFVHPIFPSVARVEVEITALAKIPDKCTTAPRVSDDGLRVSHGVSAAPRQPIFARSTESNLRTDVHPGRFRSEMVIYDSARGRSTCSSESVIRGTRRNLRTRWHQGIPGAGECPYMLDFNRREPTKN